MSKYSDDHKSDTDSGRSSAHGDKELPLHIRNEHAIRPSGQLKVTRCTEEKLKILFNSRPSNQKLNELAADAKKTEPFASGRLQVIRRKDAILKRRNMHRRNTIDVNLYDIQRAADNRQYDGNLNAHTSKSTNCIDKIDRYSSSEFANRIDALNFNGASMPGEHQTINHTFSMNRIYFTFSLFRPFADLSEANKFSTLPNLRVRRRSRVIIGNNSSDDENLSTGSSKMRGPEFILNSSLPSQEIDISDPKV